MDLNLTSQKQENFVNDTQNSGERLSVLTPKQVMVGCKVKMSHKERQKWLNNRVYYQSKEALRDAMNTDKLI